MELKTKTKKPEAVRKTTGKAGKDATAFILGPDSPFVIKEAYKALRTNIIFSLPDKGGKSVAFTSGHRSERKSSNCVNTAISFAELGSKVIILDCDMRLPTINAKFGIKGIPGMSNLLIGETSLSDAVVSVRENLDVIPAGRIPKDATGLLSSRAMEELVLKLKQIYDFVFIDLPPVTTVTDAAIISKVVDGYLVSVRHEDTENKEVAATLRQLRMSDANIIGFVYNSAPVSEKKYYSKYGYYK